jgi:hypothetical protein
VKNKWHNNLKKLNVKKICWYKSVVMRTGQENRGMQKLKCNNTFKKTESFPYLGRKIASDQKIQEDITEKFCIAGIFHQTKHYMCTFDFSDCCCFYPFMGITISFIKNVEEKL